MEATNQVFESQQLDLQAINVAINRVQAYILHTEEGNIAREALKLTGVQTMPWMRRAIVTGISSGPGRSELSIRFNDGHGAVQAAAAIAAAKGDA